MQIAETLQRFDQYLKACGFAKSTQQSYQHTLGKFSDYLEYGNGPLEVEALRKDHLVGFWPVAKRTEKRATR